MGSSPTVGAMSKKIYKSYVVVGTGDEEGAYLVLDNGVKWKAYYGNATMFSDLAQADFYAEKYNGVVKIRTVTEVNS